MAYLRAFDVNCQRCTRGACVEVFSRRNASYGKFCRRCGQAEVRRLEKEEARNDEMAEELRQRRG